MRKIAKITENDRKALFHNTAAKMGMTDAIIEKDFGCVMCLIIFFTTRSGKIILRSKAVQVYPKRMV